jgi:hypothetical protein
MILFRGTDRLSFFFTNKGANGQYPIYRQVKTKGGTGHGFYLYARAPFSLRAINSYQIFHRK